MKKSLTLILLFSVFGIAFSHSFKKNRISVYSYQKTSNDSIIEPKNKQEVSENWKRIKDKKNNFPIECPKKWIAEKTHLLFTCGKTKGFENTDYKVIISDSKDVKRINSFFALDPLLKEEYTVTEEMITINGINASLRTTTNKETQYQEKSVIIKTKTRYYNIYFSQSEFEENFKRFYESFSLLK